jgi:uncharacterized membrane protein
MKNKLLLGFFILSFIASVILSTFSTSAVCNLDLGCDVVHNSPYNYILGIQNSYFGVVIFALGSWLIFLQTKHPNKERRTVIHAMVIAGAIIALYFISVQAFILNSYCEWCLVVDVSMLIALFITIMYWKKL